MSKKKHRPMAAARDRPEGGRDKRSGKPLTAVYFGNPEDMGSLKCRGYTRLSDSPEISAGVDRIAALIGSMPIQLMRNGEKADVREYNGISRVVDINPNPFMTRAGLLRWIVRTLYFHDGNAVVLPITERGFLRELRPVPYDMCAFSPEGIWRYRILINGQAYDPENLLHFTLNPGDFYPWKGEGVRVAIGDVANNLKQATHTEKGFMESKWKPSVIIKVDGLTEEFAGEAGRRKLLDSYVTNSEAGEPWLIPADQFEVQTVKPLSLSDLALADFVELDKRTVASILGVPPFVLGVGEFKREEWHNFVSSYIMPLAEMLAQELTKKLLYSSDLYFRFNARALMNYDIKELVSAGAEMVDRMAMRRNEWRAWLNLPYDEEMEPLLALENYIPAEKLGEQKKLQGGDG